MWLIGLNVLKNYWKQLAIVALFTMLLGVAYCKGRKDCATQMEKAVVKDLERTFKSVEEERGRTNDIRETIRSDRERNPLDDKRDSCILSNDPFQTRCIK